MGRVFKAVGAFVVLAAMLVGLPVLAVRLGWPLPRSLPAVHDLATALRRPLPDGFTLRLVAALVWVVWAQLLLAVVAELRSRQRKVPVGRVAPRKVQSFVAELVTAVALLAGPTATAAGAAPLAPAGATVVATVHTVPGGHGGPWARAPGGSSAVTSAGPAAKAPDSDDVVHRGGAVGRPHQALPGRSAPSRSGGPAAGYTSRTDGPYTLWPGFPAPGGPPPAAVPAGAKFVRTVPGDTLWSVGVTHMGDGMAGEKIWALNGGRIMDDGSQFTNAWLIRPGWTLIMPDDATGCQVKGTSPSADQPPAGATTGGAAQPPPVASAPATLAPPATAAAAATPATTPVPITAPPATSPPVAAAPAVSRNGAVSPRPARAPLPGGPGWPGWLAPAGGGGVLLATFALLEARRRRARALRRSRAGAVMPPTDPTVAPLLVEVPRSADVAAVDRLQAALYHLATVADDRLRPQVILRHRDGRVDVQLFCRAEPIAPWTAAANKLFWTVAADAELPEPDPTVIACPALVQLGVCEDGGELYVDLEGLGMLGLSGSPATVRQVARALIATLVVSPSGDLCRVWTMGFDPYGLDERVERRLVAATSMDLLLEMAEVHAGEVVEEMESHHAGSSFQLRAMDRDDDWVPALVVLAGTPLTGDETARLVALAGDGGRGAAVVCAGANAVWNLELVDQAGGWWRLDPLGIRVRPVQMALEELQELSGYLADADIEPQVVAGSGAEDATTAEEPPSTNGSTASAASVVDTPAVVPAPGVETPAPAAAAGPTRPAAPVGAGGGFVERDWRVLVCTVGQPRVVNRAGVVGEQGRTAPLQLLAWLVAHRDTATRIGAREALWAGKVVKPETVRQAFFRAREICRGLAGEGRDFFPQAGGALRPDPLMVWDFELLADRLAYARRVDDPAEAAQVLVGGLHLVRGVPYQDTGWVWPDEDRLHSKLAMVATAVATELANLRIKLGQSPEAAEAAEAGLQVIPNGDELTRLRIKAHLAAGDRQRAWLAFEEYERATAGRGEDIDMGILELRDQMMGRR